MVADTWCVPGVQLAGQACLQPPHCLSISPAEPAPSITCHQGAFGEVRICRDRSTGKLVAVKKLRKSEMVRRGQVSAAGRCGCVGRRQNGMVVPVPASSCCVDTS